MVDPFSLIIQKMIELGVISFFIPWVITTTVFWALLKKSKLIDSSFANAVLSVSISFLFWGYLASSSFQIGKHLSMFITQGFVIIIVFLFGLLGASMFYPKFGESMNEMFKKKTMIWVFLALFFGVLFFTSGMYEVFLSESPISGVSGDVTMLIVMLVALIIGMLILVGVKSGLGG